MNDTPQRIQTFWEHEPIGLRIFTKRENKIKETRKRQEKSTWRKRRRRTEEGEEWVGNTKTTRQLIPYSQPIVSDAGRLINIFPADSSILSFIVLFFCFVYSSCLLSTSHGTKFLVVSNDTRNLCIGGSSVSPIQRAGIPSSVGPATHQHSWWRASTRLVSLIVIQSRNVEATLFWKIFKNNIRSYPRWLICKFQLPIWRLTHS
jgi:hypothetical protein